jgi:hypothetical protein
MSLHDTLALDGIKAVPEGMHVRSILRKPRRDLVELVTM